MTLRWPWIALFVVFVVCIPLFAPDHLFFGDWPNHLAMIGYAGESLKAHATLPATFDTNDTIGRATPLFYGSLFLPPLGALSALFGPRAALALAAAAMLFLQFASVRVLARDVARDEGIANALATIVTWAIYPLTDLYNRAAIPEFFAITTLQAGSCLWAYYARDPARRPRASLAAGLLVTLGAGIHPPTALFGGLTFLAIWAASLWWSPEPRRVLRRSLALSAAGAGVLSPWLYVVGKFRGQLQVVHANAALQFFSTCVDTVATRLSLLPTPGEGEELRWVTTPHLDAQVSLPLLAALSLLGVLAVASRRSEAEDREVRRALAVAAFCAAVTLALFRLSTSLSPWSLLPKSFVIVQFNYRLVPFVNMAALAALTGVLAALTRGDGQLAIARTLLVAALVVAAVGVAFKLPRCLAGGSPADAAVTDYANPPRDWYYGTNDYAAPDAFAKLDRAAPKQAVKLTVGGANGFGVVAPAHVHAGARTPLTTNVQAFPWNVLTVDGEPVPHEATLADGFKLAAWVGPGDHEIGYQFHPDRAWSALHAMSLVLLLLWAGASAFGPALARRSGARFES